MSVLTPRAAAHSVVARDDLDVSRSVETASVRVVSSPAVDSEPTRDFLASGSANSLHELLLAVASGDEEAFADLERRIGGLVRANIRRVLRDASRSNAVTQEYFAEMPRDASDFDPDLDSAQSWLLTRAHQRAMSGLTSGHAARR